MIDILRTVHIEKTRKPHKCFGCSRIINPPARMTLVATAQDGTAYTDYFCSTCELIRYHRASECRDGFFEFGEGDLLEGALEIEAKATLIVDAYKQAYTNNPQLGELKR